MLLRPDDLKSAGDRSKSPGFSHIRYLIRNRTRADAFQQRDHG
jgi:hypothetical protein